MLFINMIKVIKNSDNVISRLDVYINFIIQYNPVKSINHYVFRMILKGKSNHFDNKKI